ncbi:MAG: sulfurtransferase [Tolypothrix carrinoi HA7290-LM1]|jgi:thiosulfate/3-mercaptopyruvate sulfurtransferase|nr:sulfurtransferase [Tolypothrix carrinoi HA7290-LM1]
MNQWILTANQAKQLISQSATILDTRNKLAWFLGHIPDAIHVTWQEFSQPEKPYQGNLLKDEKLLQQKLCKLGISNSKPVIVIGNPAHNFGEEGRIVWMLRTLGHNSAAFVDGGYNALVKAGIQTTFAANQPQKIGDFVVNRTALWEIQRDELKANLAENKLIIIDTREKREYNGATPYGEKRKGHIPGAVHFYFKDLIDNKGNLLPTEEIITKLARLGIQLDTPIATYCTGGIRSAFFVSVMANLGLTNVKNYAGSMWEWSAESANSYPLQENL